MTRMMVYAFMILSLNVALGLLQGIDAIYISEGHTSLFGEINNPYVDYSVIEDYTGEKINLTNKNNVENASNNIFSFTDTGASDSSDWWAITKRAGSLIFNTFKTGLFGLPYFLESKWGLHPVFSTPLYIIIGIIWILGLYSIIRGQELGA